jgi:hypothetical protein
MEIFMKLKTSFRKKYFIMFGSYLFGIYHLFVLDYFNMTIFWINDIVFNFIYLCKYYVRFSKKSMQY